MNMVVKDPEVRMSKCAVSLPHVGESEYSVSLFSDSVKTPTYSCTATETPGFLECEG